LIQTIAEVVCAIYWFHPLVWLASRSLRSEAESACDDEVIRSGFNPSAYAGHLLGLWKDLRSNAIGASAAALLFRRAELETRLNAILDAGRSKKMFSLRMVIATQILFLAIFVPVAALSPANRAHLEENQTETQSEKAIPATGDEIDGCWGEKQRLPPTRVYICYSLRICSRMGE
jgi:beta-lactamase regulating signal transducer with metallopeptidase domain